MQNRCNIYSGKLYKSLRASSTENIITKNKNVLQIVYTQNDSLETFEANLNEISGRSSSLYNFKKRVVSIFLSFISVTVILFALISSSLYEDVLKKIIFESPLAWNTNDSISILFVVLFFFGLLMMPSILDGESSQFKDVLKSWFNKDIRILKRLKLSFSQLDKKMRVDIFNIDIENIDHWTWRLLLPCLKTQFLGINIYVRNDQKKSISKKLEKLGFNDIEIYPHIKLENDTNSDVLLSSKEETLYSLIQLSSTNIFDTSSNIKFVSLELFEYCGRNFLENKNDKSGLISGFQNFINRSFDDFRYLKQDKLTQVYFTKNVKLKDLDDEKRRLSYYLRNHIEECLDYFDNPISLLVLYYYVKDVVLDDKRTVAILEKLILAIKTKQQYDLINTYWFSIAGEMFDSSKIKNFELTNNSIYRKLSIASLNNLMFLFERNGHFPQALYLAQYLYEINPSKYSIDICSLHERMGNFKEAYEALPDKFEQSTNKKPTDIEVRFYQRKAWLIVSQRREDKKEEGIEALKILESILFLHKDNNEPLWLWHFYNVKANYSEWNKNYDEAIRYYKKSLCIPALGAFEYGATFVNMSIALRFKFIESNEIDIINESIKVGEVGLFLKQSVGDRDEMPVVLHNQALNILYKILHKDNDELIQSVILLTNKGISILDSTSSVKKLGMMLCENIIAKSLNNSCTDSLIKRFEQHWTQMDKYEKEQASFIYDMFVQKNKCKKLQIEY